jgi:hypothetical protein
MSKSFPMGISGSMSQPANSTEIYLTNFTAQTIQLLYICRTTVILNVSNKGNEW